MPSKKSKDNDDSKEKEVPYQPNPPSMNGVPDLSQLVYLEMKNVLFNCEWRYCKMERKHCYTSVSTILVAINPYERLQIYGQDVITEFHEAQKKGRIPSNRPHPYCVSARSYMRMVQRKQNQSVIVCGESGAGKVYQQIICAVELWNECVPGMCPEYNTKCDLSQNRRLRLSVHLNDD